MKWFTKKKDVKKKDENSTYLKIEKGEVVPVVNEKKPVTPEKKQEKDTEAPNPDTIEEKPSHPYMKWLWLLFIALLSYGTFQLYGHVAEDTQETFKLQEIQRNTVQVKENVDENTSGTAVDDGSETLPKISDVTEKAENWKAELKNSFTKNDEPKAQTGESVDSNVLLQIRKVDEDGTLILQEIRNASVKYIQGDISRGQYILRLQSIDLKLNRHLNELNAVKTKVPKGHRYENLLDYVSLKEDSLQNLVGELRVIWKDGISSTFNNYVDIHNELTVEADKTFIEELKELGYTVTVKDGIIGYN